MRIGAYFHFNESRVLNYFVVENVVALRIFWISYSTYNFKSPVRVSGYRLYYLVHAVIRIFPSCHLIAPSPSPLRFCDSSGIWIFGMQNVCQAKTSLPFAAYLHMLQVCVCTYVCNMYIFMYACVYISTHSRLMLRLDSEVCGGRRVAGLDK